MENLWSVTIEDLKVAVNLGYTFEGSVKHAWRFTRGDCNIWMVKDGWQTAEIDNYNLFSNHKLFTTNLQDALRRDW